MSKPLKTVIRVIAVIIMCVLLYLAFRGLDIGQIFNSIKSINPYVLAALVALQLFTQAAVNAQWVIIGRATGTRVGFFTMLYINCQGNVIESVTPGAKIGGEVTRAVLLKKHGRMSGTQAASFVTIQKLISMSAFVMLNIAAVIFLAGKINFLRPVYVRLPLSAALALVLLFFVSVLFAPGFWRRRLPASEPKGRVGQVFRGYFERTLDAAAMLGGAGRLNRLGQGALAVFIWLLYPLKMYLLARFFAPGISLVTVAGITFLSYLIAMLPLLPGGLGSFEAGMSSMLAAAGMTLADGMAAAVVFRFVTFWLVIVLSGLFIAASRCTGVPNETAVRPE